MKKANTYVTALFFVLLISSCGTKDNKNEVENYPTYDTTSKMENINNGSADSSSSHEKTNSGDIH